MYVNKPVVRLSTTPKTKEVNIFPANQNASKKSKPSGDIFLEDKELDNLELLYELEYKVEKLAGVLSVGLDEVASVAMDEAHQDDLNKSRQLIQMGIKKQIKRELEILSRNQVHKAKLETYTEQIKRTLEANKKILQQYRETIKNNETLLKQSKGKQERLLQVQRQLEQALGERSRLITGYRESQEKSQKLKQQLSDLDNQMFAKEEQLEESRRESERYRSNIDNITQYAELQRYRKRLCDDYNNKGDIFQKMSKERIEEIVAIRTNIAKIDQMMNGIQAELYEQKCFLRAGQQERIYHQQESEEQQPSPPSRKPKSQQRLMKQYQQIYLPPLDDKWNRYKSKLTRYFSEKQNPQFDDSYEKVSNHRHNTNHRSMTQNSSGEEDEDEIRPTNFKSLRKRSSKPRTQNSGTMDERRREQQKIKAQNNNTVKLTLKTKKEAEMLKDGKRRLELESLYSRNSDHLKNKIASHLKHKKPNSRLRDPELPSPKKDPARQSDSMQLVSVPDSQNDSKYQYVQVQLSKNELAALSQRKSKN